MHLLVNPATKTEQKLPNYLFLHLCCNRFLCWVSMLVSIIIMQKCHSHVISIVGMCAGVIVHDLSCSILFYPDVLFIIHLRSLATPSHTSYMVG